MQICPRQCIHESFDNEGFYYPYVVMNECINCGKCEKVCPILNQAYARTPFKLYAAKNPNENTRILSSSGGIFTLLSNEIIKRKGPIGVGKAIATVNGELAVSGELTFAIKS